MESRGPEYCGCPTKLTGNILLCTGVLQRIELLASPALMLPSSCSLMLAPIISPSLVPRNRKNTIQCQD